MSKGGIGLIYNAGLVAENCTSPTFSSSAGGCTWPNNMLQSYARAQYGDSSTTWGGFGSWVPHAVVVNLGENDGAFDVRGTPPGTIGPEYHCVSGRVEGTLYGCQGNKPNRMCQHCVTREAW